MYIHIFSKLAAKGQTQIYVNTYVCTKSASRTVELHTIATTAATKGKQNKPLIHELNLREKIT